MSSRPAHGRVVKGVWRKHVRKSVSMLRRPLGWAVDLADLEAAKRLGATSIAVHDQESGRTYTTTIARLQERGFGLNRGFGPQCALALRHWEVTHSVIHPSRERLGRERPGRERAEQLTFDLGGDVR